MVKTLWEQILIEKFWNVIRFIFCWRSDIRSLVGPETYDCKASYLVNINLDDNFCFLLKYLCVLNLILMQVGNVCNV
jgi:hypothetical protein